MRVTSRPVPALDDLSAPRLVLRDGSVASVRIAQAADRDAVRRFFHALPAEDRFRRFLTVAEPSDALIDRCCGALAPSVGLTIIALRLGADAGERIVAIASYLAAGHGAAEVAFAVEPGFQGHGLGTLLLEQLAAHARLHGFERIVATTLADNAAMLDVFRQSGYRERTTTAAGITEVELGLTMDAAGIAGSEQRRHHATVESVTHLLKPRSVAVIGASRDAQKIGSRILAALKQSGFAGQVFVVHPEGAAIQDVAAVRSARDLPPGVDLAIIAVPAAAVIRVVEDCASRWVRTVLIVTAGFAESGHAGRMAEDALLNLVRGYGMRMVGPNCMGVLNFDAAVRLNASFAPVVPAPGHVSLASQSGALGIAVLDLVGERGIGVSSFVSLGNKADLSSNDLLEYWEDDAATRVVLLYLESFGNPRRFARIARRLSRKKPIVALKAGRSAAGSRAAASHTASLAANDGVVSELFRQCGVIRADTIDEMMDIAACLDLQPLPSGKRVAIVTNAGGPGILAVDACEVASLSLATFDAATRARLAAALPAAASCDNPVDMLAAAGPAEYGATLEAVLKDPGVDAVIAIYTPVETVRPGDILASIGAAVSTARKAGGAGKPVLLCAIMRRRGPTPLDSGSERLPTYFFPENAVRALGKIAGYAEWRREPEGQYWECEDVRVTEARDLCREVLDTRGPG